MTKTMTEEYDLTKSSKALGKPCEFCGTRVAVLTEHQEYHLPIPRKLNLCEGCHLELHNLPLREQCVSARIKIPRTALPFFQNLYTNILSKNGELIYNGEMLFNARYEVVDDDKWNGGGLEQIVFADLQRRWEKRE